MSAFFVGIFLTLLGLFLLILKLFLREGNSGKNMNWLDYLFSRTQPGEWTPRHQSALLSIVGTVNLVMGIALSVLGWLSRSKQGHELVTAYDLRALLFFASVLLCVVGIWMVIRKEGVLKSLFNRGFGIPQAPDKYRNVIFLLGMVALSVAAVLFVLIMN